MKKIQLILALVAAFIFQGFSQNDKTKQGLDIAGFEAKLKQAGNNAQILDARTLEEYTQNHLKGAISFTATTDADVEQAFAKLEKQKPVFVYSIGNGRSGRLAQKLTTLGFKEVYELPEVLAIGLAQKDLWKARLVMDFLLAITKKLLQSDKQAVLVDVSSRYCGACKKLAPIVDSLSRENSSTIKLVKIEFFDNKQLAQELNVDAIPALFLYKGGKVVWQKVGITPKAEIQSKINKATGIN